MMISLLLTLSAQQPEMETLGVLPDDLRLHEDPEGVWVGRVGVGLSPEGLWLSGQALPRWSQTPERGYDPGLLAALETHTQAGRLAAEDRRFTGEIYVEIAPETSFGDLLVVLGSAERAGFSSARVRLPGQDMPEPFSTRVGLRPMGGRQIFRLEQGLWVEDLGCSSPGTPNERILSVGSGEMASQWLPLLQRETGAFRLAEVDPQTCL